MSIYNMMRTGVSGMQAQSNRLATVADNIANSDTTGYKRYSTQFSSMVTEGGATSGNFSSGGVLTDVRQSISAQGALQYTTSITDLAVQGNGFFVVQDASGTPMLTRAGSFVPNGDGQLVNAAGYFLAGYDMANGDPAATANGFDGLEVVSIAGQDLVAVPTTLGKFAANLPSSADIVTAPPPSANAATSAYSEKSSLVTYDNLGGSVLLDLYFTKTAANTWEVTAYNQADAAAGTGFPYASGPLATDTLTFDATNGNLAGGSPTQIALTIPGGAAATIDLSEMTQLSTGYIVEDAEVNGSAPNAIEGVDIDDKGVLYARYGDGTFRALYKIPLANVISPDQLISQTGNVFSQSADSGDVTMGFAGEGSLGNIVSSALEQSNVDIADELTTMIQSQRGFTANSKVFQTGSDLMDVVVNLKR